MRREAKKIREDKIKAHKSGNPELLKQAYEAEREFKDVAANALDMDGNRIMDDKAVHDALLNGKLGNNEKSNNVSCNINACVLW